MALATLLGAVSAHAFDAVAPGNLNATVDGMVVNLTWEWGNAGELVFSDDFEGEMFPSAGWEVKTTNTFDEYCTWMRYEFSEEDGPKLSHSGLGTAMLMMGEGDVDDLSTYHQDEWLIVRPGAGAAYMDFWYYIHPELLEVGGMRDFPDHYYVKVSFDNGESWDELWDGRWDIGRENDVRQASLFLGDDSDENTLVAFQGVSGDEESLYFLWAIDDVEFYSADEYAERKLTAKTTGRKPSFEIPEGLTLRRDFTPSSFEKAPARLPVDEWLNNGNYSYRVYLDGELVGDYLKTRSFTDYSTKEEGTHTYKVVAWLESMDEEFDASEIDVYIDKVTFMPPTNLVGEYQLQDNGKYVVAASWEAPEGELQPSYYLIYINGKQFGWIDAYEELSAGQSGLYKGVYDISVEARYEYPEGASERVTVYVFPGTVPTPVGLSLEENGDEVRLSWNYQESEEVSPESYSVYRGDELLAEGLTEFEFVDNSPLDMNCLYSVHAVFADGTVSLPAVVGFEPEVVANAELPLEESFSHGHLPAGWRIDLVDTYGIVKDMYNWRFDNWFDMEPSQESGVDGGFASVSGVAAGMNKLQSYLVTPAFELPSDKEAVVSFDKYFFEEKEGPSGPASLILAVSTSNGEWWDDLMTDLASIPDGKVEHSLAAYAGKTIQLRWGFLGRNSGVAAVDNIKVSVPGTDSVDAVSSSAEIVEVYTVDGIKVGESLEGVPSGIYVVKMSDGTVKKQLLR